MSEHGAVADEPSIYDEGSTAHVPLRIAAVAALGGLLFGYDSSVINGANDSIAKRFHVDSVSLGFAVASALLGAAVGAMLAGRIADRFGRLTTMKVAAVLFLISAIVTGFAPALWVVVLGRILGGLGVGLASVIAPAYIAEISPAHVRGRLGSLQQLAIVTGIFLAFLVNYTLQKIAGSADAVLWLGQPAWRWMFLMMAIPAVVYGVLAFTIPESPRFLISQGRIDQARRVLGGLLGTRGLDVKIVQIRQTLKSERKPSIRDLKGPAFGLAPIVWVGILLSVFQQFVGINVIFYYSNILWQAVGFDQSQAFLISLISSIINVLTTLIAIATIDKFGRKPLLLVGSAGMTISLAVMAFVFATAPVVNGTPHLNSWQGPVALIAANLFVIAFGMSWGPVVWVLLGETFPNRIRASALSVAAAAQWVANWIITETFPSLRDLSLGLAYGLYAGFALLSFVFVKRWVRETNGVELEDMHHTVD
ncbi:sugar porter family MFS transporter [Calidifontibacter sp. DB0510]|uniref:Sugar porter family MFS transporter n=1 Tax=Metallococcus carri TaxID=1656884 RepID=A0A967EFL7_9MICO|nr:sugar porter family MFS transporter [Metallococcus carri]NHN56746.1 sugar porter family MFS transporter [Metallococcus carri]NOP37877.1 sugar porter family MFS transporter [Calidifontibacter sp. DB2511S]